MTPVFHPSPEMVRSLHDRTILREGGAPGLRDENAFLSIWSRIDAALAYADPDVVDLAARLAHGLLRNHPFVDGNKRSAWGAFRMTLSGNGMTCTLEDRSAARMIVASAAAGDSAESLADIFRPHCVPDPVLVSLFQYDMGHEIEDEEPCPGS